MQVLLTHDFAMQVQILVLGELDKIYCCHIFFDAVIYFVGLKAVDSSR
jgi:hypothetical protein